MFEFRYLVILFPLATALYALLWFLHWMRLHRSAAPLRPQRVGPAADAAPEAALPAAPLPEPEPEADKAFRKKDALALGIITAVYAIVAFIGLGDTKAPESFLQFESAGYYAEIDLGEPRELSLIRYYPGLGTADYRLTTSADGEEWLERRSEDGGAAMANLYNNLFRWNDASIDGELGAVRYIRIASGGAEALGEVALYDADGVLIPAEEYSVAPGCEALTDEQALVPEKYNYKNGTYFDEIYFPRTAFEMIKNMWPYEITHPPLGKAIISVGIRLFGMTPFGWRFMGVLFGILMLPVLYILIKRMFGYTTAAACGTILFAFDFMHYTQTRLATIDTYAVFFTLLMYLFLYLWLTEPEGRRGKRLLWLGLAGLSFGLGAASKWVCIYAGAGLGVIWAAYWIVRFVREKKAVLAAFAENVGWCILFFVLVPVFVYCASYWTYAPSQGITGPLRMFDPRYFKLVVDNQTYMWNYHSDLVATHPYSSSWYQWLLDIRPILYYLEYFSDGTKSAFGAFSNPIVCWGGLLAMGGMVWLVIRERDRKALFILIGYLMNLGPWMLVSRLTFAYHYFPCTVFLVLALARIFEDLRRRDEKWQISIGAFTAVAVGLFAMFYPVLSGLRVSTDYTTYFLKWFADTWPF